MSEIVLSESEQQCSVARYLNFEGKNLNTDKGENDATLCMCVHTG